VKDARERRALSLPADASVNDAENGDALPNELESDEPVRGCGVESSAAAALVSNARAWIRVYP